MIVSTIVHQQAHRFFASAQADEVIAALDRSDLSLGLTSPDRVHLAILLISKGNMQQFRMALSQASYDWRNTLVAAGLAAAQISFVKCFSMLVRGLVFRIPC
jgi:hypothetical protein